MLIKKAVLLPLIAVLVFAAAGCSRKPPLSPENAAYTFTDSEGTTVALAHKPERVAVLFSSYADIWTTAGGTVAVTVGESVERGFADGGAVIVDPGSGHSTIDMETLIAAEPDLVIGTTDYACQRDAVNFCRSVDIPAALFGVESFDDYLRTLGIFCALTGNEQNYQRYGSDVKSEITSILDGLSEAGEKKKILFVRAGSSARSTKAKTTDDNFACKMLAELGTQNIADSENALSGVLSLEVIMDKDPEHLFISTMGDETAAKAYMNSLLSSDGWRTLDCVKSGRCHYLPKDLFHFKPNSRWAEAYRYLLSVLYPEK